MKALLIALKDTRQRLRDPLALILQITGPLLILLILGLVFGGERGLEPTIVYLVDLDGEALGQVYVSALTSAEIKEFVQATVVADEAAARAAVDAGQAASAVIIPPGFTQAVFQGQAAQVRVYSDPAQTIGPAVVRSIVEGLTFGISKNYAAVKISLAGLIQSGRITPDQQAAVAQQLAQQLGQQSSAAGTDSGLNNEAAPADTRADAGASAGAGIMAYFAPAMLVFSLMLAAIRSGGSLLEEKESGTLARLFTAPISRNSVIVGKLLGNLLQCGLQAAILVVGLTFLFKVNLGDPIAVILLLLGLVLCLIALGLVIAGLIRNPDAVNGASSAVALVLGLLGGNIAPPTDNAVLKTLATVTPNHWAMEGFLTLAGGGTVADVLLPLAVLAGMTLVLALLAGRLLTQKLNIA